MSTGINEVNGIIIAIAIEVQAVYVFGIEVGSAIGRNKSAPLGGVISGVAVIQAGIVIVVIATVTKTGLLQPLHRHIYYTIFPAHSQEKASQLTS